VTTLYDLSSLRELPNNLQLIIINNHGGRIFDMLGLDKRIVLEHKENFKRLCQGLNLSYSQDLSDWGAAQVLELCPDQLQTEKYLAEWGK
jgi:2-succinyl-5-enolpyruvyl-6-hydroxy-3-cyclohexene-1-carboxylate synthase